MEKAVFEKRYDELVNIIKNSKKKIGFYTKTRKIFFQLGVNRANSLHVVKSKNMNISKERLWKILSENENYSYKSYDSVLIDYLFNRINYIELDPDDEIILSEINKNLEINITNTISKN